MKSVKYEYSETDKITGQVTVHKKIGYLTGVSLRTRYIDENTLFEDVYISINNVDYKLSSLTSLKIAGIDVSDDKGYVKLSDGFSNRISPMEFLAYADKEWIVSHN